MRRINALCSLLIATGLAGCASAPTSRPHPLSESPRNATTIHLNTEISNTPRNGTSGTETSDTETSSTGTGTPAPTAGLILVTPASRLRSVGATTYIPADTYTRLVITSKNQSANGTEDNPEIYPYKTRSPLERFFVGTRHSATLAAKVTSGPFAATVPLLTVSHDSTRRDGEVFDRMIRHEASAFPIFLVGGNAGSDVATLTFELKGNDKVESSAAGTALSAVLAVANVAGAPAPLVTSLSKDSSRNLATSIDSAIDSLFAMKLAETQVLDHSIRKWQPVTITLRLPRRAGGWKDTLHPVEGATHENDLAYVPVGEWTAEFASPRLSAFATTTVICPAASDDSSDKTCDDAYAVAKTEVKRTMKAGNYRDVLTFPLIRDASSIGNLGSYLRQLDWWAASATALNADKAPAAVTSDFCHKVRDAVIGLGFSQLDADFTLQAVSRSSLVGDNARKALVAASADCTIR